MPRYNACEDLLDRNVAAGRGDKLAFVDPQRSITYSQLATDSRKFANVLNDLGVRRWFSFGFESSWRFDGHNAIRSTFTC